MAGQNVLVVAHINCAAACHVEIVLIQVAFNRYSSPPIGYSPYLAGQLKHSESDHPFRSFEVILNISND